MEACLNYTLLAMKLLLGMMALDADARRRRLNKRRWLIFTGNTLCSGD